MWALVKIFWITATILPSACICTTWGASAMQHLPTHGFSKGGEVIYMAAPASTNIKKVQEIGTLFLLRAVFGERGCKQTDPQKMQFWSPHSFAQKPSTMPCSIKSCLCSFTSHSCLTFGTYFANCFPKCSLASNKAAHTNHHALLTHAFASALLAPKVPFPTVAFTLFMSSENNFPPFWTPKVFCFYPFDICQFLLALVDKKYLSKLLTPLLDV